MPDRTRTQQVIPGWDQSRLLQAKVAVIGSDQLANFVTSGLAALGLGHVSVYDNKRCRKFDKNGFLYFDIEENENNVNHLVKILKKISPESDFKGIYTKILENSKHLLFKPDLIADCTNDKKSKEYTLEYCLENKIGYISASTSNHDGKFLYYNNKRSIEDYFMNEFDNKEQGPITSGVIGGVAIGEIIKHFMKLDGDVSNLPIYYNLLCEKRFNTCNELRDINSNLSDKRVLVIGAGSLGNFCSIGLALNNIGEITIADYDIIEKHNLNRQILFYDSIDRDKASELVKKLKKISSSSIIDSLEYKVDEPLLHKYLKNNNIHLIISCVDNLKTRSILNRISTIYGIPLIDGGSSYSNGQLIVYKPGETACLNCQIKIDELAKKEKPVKGGCGNVQPSVITTNMVIGSLMVGESRTLLRPDIYGRPLKNQLVYNSKYPSRLAIMNFSPECKCYGSGKN